MQHELGLVAGARVDQAGGALLAKAWSRQAWLQAMQVLISSARSSIALLTKSASASSGRAIETRSASPAARMSSASSGVLIRFDAQTGMSHP